MLLRQRLGLGALELPVGQGSGHCALRSISTAVLLLLLLSVQVVHQRVDKVEALLVRHVVVRMTDGALQGRVLLLEHHVLLLLVQQVLQVLLLEEERVQARRRVGRRRGRGHRRAGRVGGRRRRHVLDDAVDQVQVLHQQTVCVALRRWRRQSEVEPIQGTVRVLQVQVGVVLALISHSTFHARLVEGLTLWLLNRGLSVVGIRGSLRSVLVLEE